MATIYYEKDADITRLKDKKIAVIGYGSQGHAHALNMQDSGLDVRIGLHEGSGSKAKAEAEGLRVVNVATAAQEADMIMIVIPDPIQGNVYEEHIAPNLQAGNTIMFAHGFNVRFGFIVAPDHVDVSMVAPKAPGHRVREVFIEGSGVPALVAVHQDPSGEALANALAYAKAIGSTRAGVLETTFSEETETDLFGEQTVLCGGVSELVKAGFEILVEAGYQPEIAYFECLHELKLIVDLMYQGGLSYMRYSISDTAEWGDYKSGQSVITDETKVAMRKILADIQSGAFAEEWMDEYHGGGKVYYERLGNEQNQQLENVGKELRKMMTFLDAKEV